MSRIGSLAKAGFTTGTNKSSLLCHIYEFKLQRKQQITCNNYNCLPIGHAAPYRVRGYYQSSFSFSVVLDAWQCHAAPSKSSGTAFCSDPRAPRYLSLQQLKR